MIKAEKVSGYDELLLPGQYYFDHSIRVLYYLCPNCGTLGTTPYCTGGKEDKRWLWDGNEDCPTLTPSIKVIEHADKNCKWHGYLKKGQWTFCNDSRYGNSAEPKKDGTTTTQVD